MVFAIVPGRCLIVIDGADGKPMQCPNQVNASGDYLDEDGQRWHGAEACPEHESELVAPLEDAKRRLGRAAILIPSLPRKLLRQDIRDL